MYEVEVTSDVSFGERYSIGEYGPPGCVFQDPDEVEHSSTSCPMCGASYDLDDLDDAAFEKASRDVDH
jgi:hypothetical protein